MRAVVVAMLVLVGVAGNVSACSHMGSCPDPPVQQDFDIERYMGKWFEYEKFPNSFEMGSKCVTANYTLNADGTVIVLNGAIEELSYGMGLCPWYQSRVALGEGVVVDQREPAKLGVRFNPRAPIGKYWVLETDYVTYSVVYSCSRYVEAIPVYTELAWVLTRERGVAPPGLIQIYQRMQDQGIDPTQFELNDQKGCPVWPKE